MGDGRRAIGRRIKRLRENNGLSRQQVSARLSVDLTAVAAWEAGKYLPREGRRVLLAGLLGIDTASLFAEQQDSTPSNGAALVDTLGELPGLLRELLSAAERRLRAFRLAAPYSTPPHIQEEFRALVDSRLRAGTLEVERIEIFYDLKRLKEVLSNMLRYEAQPYRVRTACAGVSEVVPGMGGYCFDDSEFLLGAYWATVPPFHRAGLRLTGEPYKTYFAGYWEEIWGRGTALNGDGGIEMDAVREVAVRLGLEPGQWPDFIRDAQTLEIGDGLPPLI